MNMKTDMREWMKGVKSKMMAGITAFGLITLITMTFVPMGALAAETILFSDDFETGGFSAWSSAGDKWDVIGSGAVSGSKNAQVKGPTSGDNSLVVATSTVDFEDLILRYKYKIQNGLETTTGHGEEASTSTDIVAVEWSSDGIIWTTIKEYIDIAEGGVLSEEFLLPDAAEGNANFQLRFRGNLNAGSDDFRLDDVSLSGTLFLEESAATNTAPVAENLSVITNEDTATSSAVVATDEETATSSLTYSLASSTGHGTLDFLSTGVFTYTPDENFNGEDFFLFLANDGTDNSPVATTTITVNPVNDAPTISLNGSSTVNLTVGDPYVEEGATGSDVDGDELTASTTGSVDTGTAGTTTLVYSVNDGEFSASTTRKVIVSPAPTPTTTPESTPAPSPAPAPESGGGDNRTSGGSGFVNPVSTTTATTTTGTTPNTTGTTSPFIFAGNNTGSQNQNQNRNGNSTGANTNSTTSPLVTALAGGNATGTGATTTTTDEFSTTTDGNGSNTGDNTNALAAAGLLGGLGNLPWWSWLLLILIALGLWGVFREKDTQ